MSVNAYAPRLSLPHDGITARNPGVNHALLLFNRLLDWRSNDESVAKRQKEIAERFVTTKQRLNDARQPVFAAHVVRWFKLVERFPLAELQP